MFLTLLEQMGTHTNNNYNNNSSFNFHSLLYNFTLLLKSLKMGKGSISQLTYYVVLTILLFLFFCIILRKLQLDWKRHTFKILFTSDMHHQFSLLFFYIYFNIICIFFKFLNYKNSNSRHIWGIILTSQFCHK